MQGGLQAWGESASFVFVFTGYFINGPAGRALGAFAMSRYMYGAINPSETGVGEAVWMRKLIALLGILIVTLLNVVRIRFAARIMQVFMMLKLGLIGLIVIFMIVQLSRTTSVLTANFANPFEDAEYKNLGLGLVAAGWAYR